VKDKNQIKKSSVCKTQMTCALKKMEITKEEYEKRLLSKKDKNVVDEFYAYQTKKEKKALIGKVDLISLFRICTHDRGIGQFCEKNDIFQSELENIQHTIDNENSLFFRQGMYSIPNIRKRWLSERLKERPHIGIKLAAAIYIVMVNGLDSSFLFVVDNPTQSGTRTLGKLSYRVVGHYRNYTLALGHKSGLIKPKKENILHRMELAVGKISSSINRKKKRWFLNWEIGTSFVENNLESVVEVLTIIMEETGLFVTLGKLSRKNNVNVPDHSIGSQVYRCGFCSNTVYDEPGSGLCGECLVEAYCSKECQTKDWDSHSLHHE